MCRFSFKVQDLEQAIEEAALLELDVSSGRRELEDTFGQAQKLFSTSINDHS